MRPWEGRRCGVPQRVASSTKCNPGDELAVGTPFRFKAVTGTLTAMFLHSRLRPLGKSLIAAVLGLSAAGCSSAGRFLREMLRERPPAPLDSLSVASDARIDSAGYLVGSFVGEGTSRAVYLLSSDTGLIAAMLRRYRPTLGQQGDLWEALARERVVSFGSTGRRRTRHGTPVIDRALVGSPLGHSAVTPGAMLVHGGRCGRPGAQLEIVVEEDPSSGGPPLRGPVLGSFSRSTASAKAHQSRERLPLREAGDSLTHELIRRTERSMDSLLATGFKSLRLRPIPGDRLEINTLADVSAAEARPFLARASTARYAVSLRARRLTVRSDTLLASIVMAWDSIGSWQQTIFRPTLISIERGRLRPYGALRRSLFWRRLQPISDFGFERDNLWMEQVDVHQGTVLWGIVQPSGNVIVAAAEVARACP
jgi:hypothetical protein